VIWAYLDKSRYYIYISPQALSLEGQLLLSINLHSNRFTKNKKGVFRNGSGDDQPNLVSGLIGRFIFGHEERHCKEGGNELKKRVGTNDYFLGGLWTEGALVVGKCR
jgi:hypothetical protein